MRLVNRAFLSASLVLVGLASQSAFGGVLTVAPSGAQYAQIQTAVNAAAQGDVILISPGSYWNGVTIDGKSLTLCSTTTASVTILGTTTVRNLTATQRVVLSGLRSVGQPVGAPGGTLGLYVSNNAGHVRAEYCAFVGADGFGDGFGDMASCCYAPAGSAGFAGAWVVSNTQGVSFTACEFQGGRSANSNSAWPTCQCGWSHPGGDGLSMQSTLVSLYDCNLRGGNGGHNGAAAGDGGAALRLTNGAPITGACCSGSRFQGGRGGDGLDWLCGEGGYGGNGIVVGSQTSVRLLDNTFVQGMGGSWYANFSQGQPAPNISGFGAVHTDTESRLVMTTDRLARAGSVIDIRVQGAPGQIVQLLLSRAPTFQILPSWHGTMLSLPSKGSVEVQLGQIPANGILQTRYTAPPLPAGLASVPVFVQAYRDDPVLGPKLAAGTCLTLLP